MGDISRWDAIKNIKDQLGVSWEEARTMFDMIDQELPGRLQQIEGYMEGVTEAIGPEAVDMQPLADNIRQGSDDITQSVTAITDSFGGIGPAMEPVVTQSAELYQVWQNFSPIIDGVRDEFDSLFDDLRRAIVSAVGQVNSLQDAIDSLEGKEIDIEVNVNYNYSGTPPPGGSPFKSWRAPIPAATGLDLIVPPGYPNDSYPVRAQSGERVIVIPRSQVSASSGAARGETIPAGGGIGAVNMGPFYIQIVAASGQSPAAIVGMVERKMYDVSRRTAAALAAGAQYSGA
jgi:hypothetical protein